jgi:choline kinase
MRAVILAAGVGARLGSGEDHPPKAMLRFADKTLLSRHLEILRHCGLDEVVIVTGYRAELFEEAVAPQKEKGFARILVNPDFRLGSILSLWTAREVLHGGDEILLMDADVLNDFRMIERLRVSGNANCFLMDRDFEAGDEPVKLCIREGEIVDFHKKVTNSYDFCGESVGFFRLSADIAARLAYRAQAYVDEGREDEWYEEAIRDLVIECRDGTFGYEDVTGIPWIEIDFPEDVERAREEILPHLKGLKI